MSGTFEKRPGARFSKLPVITGPVKLFWNVFHSIPDGNFKRFENRTVKLSAKERKWTSLEVRTHPTFLENLISKYVFGPVQLPGVSRNGPLVTNMIRADFRETDRILFCAASWDSSRNPL